MSGERTWNPGGPQAAEIARLASELGGSALQSVLLELLRQRARRRTPAEVLGQHRSDRRA
jgi:hypothetical protein